ncbi:MAG: HEAT repeat domain-containing protein [Streptosporangiaceae bacterium]
MPAIWRLTPRQNIAAECQQRGKPAVVSGCIDLLQGRPGVDDTLVLALGGPPAQDVLGGYAGGKAGYWPRVWAARGLLHAWDNRATAAIIQATTDDAWRVREMAAKVIARHRIGVAFTAVAELRNDQVPRVRAAAERATVILTASGT